MRDFVFHVDTKVLFGRGQLEKLGKEAKQYGDKAMLCYGGGSIKKTGLYDKVVEQLKKSDIEIVEFSGIEPNPKLGLAKEGIELAKKEKIELIIAVGGGSVVDTAKLISAACLSEDDPWDIVIGKAPIKKALPIGAVLTIAATGSEMDPFSVITNEETKEKLGWASPFVRPTFAIMDPELTFTLPKKQTAAGIADIMAHSMENYFTVDDSAFLQDSFSEGLMKTLVKYGPVVMDDPENYEARANIMWANSWAINGLLMAGKTHSWTIHGIEHELSAFYDITHGYGLAVIAPHWLRYAMKKNPDSAKKIARFGKNVFDISDLGNEEANASAAIKALEEFFENLGIPMSLTKLGIDDSKLKEMAKAASVHGGTVIKGFVDLDEEDILEIYKMSL